jgi:hypothetical protein
MTWWALKAWPWLKKYWKWLLFPIGIIVFILGYSVRPKPKVLSSELTGAADAKKKADDKAAEETGKARAERDAQLAGIEREHASTIAKLTKEQRAKVKELREDPDKVNAFLIGVGKDIRS